MSGFQKQLHPQVRRASRLRRVSAVLRGSIPAFVAWVLTDQLLLWYWDVTVNYYVWQELVEPIRLPGFTPAVKGPAWGLGWWLLTIDEQGPLAERVGYPYPQEPLWQLVATLSPALVIVTLVLAARATQRAASSPSPRSSATHTPVGSHHKVATREGKQQNWTSVTSLTTSVTALGALIFTGLSLRATHEQNDINAEAQITNRYTQAVQLLGSAGRDARDLRLGGIYALDRIARDSPRDAETIHTLLATFVRDHARHIPDQPCPDPPATDIQAALTVLTDTAPTAPDHPMHGTPHILDLRGSCLAGADLAHANLQWADLRDARLTGADLTRAQLTGASLHGADLARAKLTGAVVTHADLGAVNLADALLDGATLTETDLTKADLTGAQLPNTRLNGADLTEANLSGANLINANLTDADLARAIGPYRR